MLIARWEPKSRVALTWIQHQDSESRLTDDPHGAPWSPGHPDVFAKFSPWSSPSPSSLPIGRMFSRARLEIKTPISLFLVTSLVILRFSHDSLTIPMAILLSLWLFPYPYGYSLIPMFVMNWHFSRSFRLIFLITDVLYLSRSYLIKLTTLASNHFVCSLYPTDNQKHVYWSPIT